MCVCLQKSAKIFLPTKVQQCKRDVSYYGVNQPTNQPQNSQPTDCRFGLCCSLPWGMPPSSDTLENARYIVDTILLQSFNRSRLLETEISRWREALAPFPFWKKQTWHLLYVHFGMQCISILEILSCSSKCQEISHRVSSFHDERRLAAHGRVCTEHHERQRPFGSRKHEVACRLLDTLPPTIRHLHNRALELSTCRSHHVASKFDRDEHSLRHHSIPQHHRTQRNLHRPELSRDSTVSHLGNLLPEL